MKRKQMREDYSIDETGKNDAFGNLEEEEDLESEGEECDFSARWSEPVDRSKVGGVKDLKEARRLDMADDRESNSDSCSNASSKSSG